MESAFSFTESLFLIHPLAWKALLEPLPISKNTLQYETVETQSVGVVFIQQLSGLE
jgi:hypothetical protein